MDAIVTPFDVVAALFDVDDRAGFRFDEPTTQRNLGQVFSVDAALFRAENQLHCAVQASWQILAITPQNL